MHRRSEATAVGDCGAPNVVLDGEHEHEMQEVKAKLLVVLRRSGEARSSGNAVTAELGGGVHGNRSHGESRGSEGEWEGEQVRAGRSGERLARVMEEQSTRRRAARGGEQGRSSGMAATHGHVSFTEAYSRTGGGQQRGHGGRCYWAISGLIKTLGPKRSLKPANCSTFFI